MILLLTAGCGFRVLPEPPAGEAAERLARHREALVAHAARMAASEESRGLDGFAAFVQEVVDRAVERAGSGSSVRAVVRSALDDLVDVSLGSSHPFVQRVLMVSPPLWRGAPVHESMFGLEGFAPVFRAGEGRLRHFALAAAAAWAFPPLAVDIAARWLGGDFAPAPDTDGAADVATNTVGRDFGLWLRRVDRATLSDGVSVGAWIRDRFSDAVP